MRYYIDYIKSLPTSIKTKSKSVYLYKDWEIEISGDYLYMNNPTISTAGIFDLGDNYTDFIQYNKTKSSWTTNEFFTILDEIYSLAKRKVKIEEFLTHF